MPGGPYNPPNPYGSYFNFGDFQGAAAESFIPFQSGGLSPGTQSLMGRPVGGFNPSPTEYLMNRVNNANMARYMASVYKGDPRTSAFTDMLLQAAYGADSKRRQATVERMGGLGNIHELVGFMMSQPGISGYLGGGPAALGLGAYAAASSGMGVNGRIMAGDGPLVQQMARSLVQQVNNRFYTPAGAQLTGMTSGLNRDQLGGLMAIMASQGAFREIDMGKLTQGANGPQLQANPGAITQFTNMVKNGAKALGAIMDVYGDASVSELFSKAQQITGLNFANPQNAQVMAQRLNSLRRTGEMFGIDAQTMFDASKMGLAMGQSLGLTGHTAAFAGTSSAEYAARMSIAVASGRSTLNGGFIPTLQEIQANNVRDIRGMTYDPIGMRRGLVSMILGQGGVRDEKARGEIQAMMATAGIGGANEHQIDAMLRRQGYELPNMIRQFGGAAGIMRNLSAQQAEEVNTANMADMERRAGFRVKQRYLQPTFGAAGDAAFTLMSAFEPSTIKDLLTKSKDPAAMNDILQRSVEARRSPDRYRQAVSAVLAASGGSAEDANARFGMVDMMARTDPLTTAFTSSQAKDNSARLAASRIPSFSLEDQRGFTKPGFLDGILNSYGGTDARSNFARLAAINPSAIAGGVGGIVTGIGGLPMDGDAFDAKRMASLVTQFQKQFSGSQAGRDLLRDMGLRDPLTGKLTSTADVNLSKFQDILMSPTQRALLFRHFEEFRLGDRSAFAPKTELDLARQFGGLNEIAKVMVNNKAVTGSAADYLMAAGIALGDPQMRIRQVRGGVAGRVLGTLTPEEAQGQADNIIRQTTSLDVLQKIGATAIKDLGRMNAQWGQTAMDTLTTREHDLIASGTDDPRMRAWIKSARDALKSVGISPRDDPGTMKLTGTLRLGDRELELVDTIIKQGKK